LTWKEPRHKTLAATSRHTLDVVFAAVGLGFECAAARSLHREGPVIMLALYAE